jgi:hypothetical protein
VTGCADRDGTPGPARNWVAFSITVVEQHIFPVWADVLMDGRCLAGPAAGDEQAGSPGRRARCRSDSVNHGVGAEYVLPIPVAGGDAAPVPEALAAHNAASHL